MSRPPTTLRPRRPRPMPQPRRFPQRRRARPPRRPKSTTPSPPAVSRRCVRHARGTELMLQSPKAVAKPKLAAPKPKKLHGPSACRRRPLTSRPRASDQPHDRAGPGRRCAPAGTSARHRSVAQQHQASDRQAAGAAEEGHQEGRQERRLLRRGGRAQAARRQRRLRSWERLRPCRSACTSSVAYCPSCELLLPIGLLPPPSSSSTSARLAPVAPVIRVAQFYARCAETALLRVAPSRCAKFEALIDLAKFADERPRGTELYGSQCLIRS